MCLLTPRGGLGPARILAACGPAQVRVASSSCVGTAPPPQAASPAVGPCRHLAFPLALSGGAALPPGLRCRPPSQAALLLPLPPEPPERDSTVAVIVGASVGGFLAVLILALVVVKCVRRKKQQKLHTDDQKTEEEGKTDGEGNPEEGPK